VIHGVIRFCIHSLLRKGRADARAWHAVLSLAFFNQAVQGRMSYVTAKHGTVGMMRSCAQDLFGMGIHTACICPGFTNTPMLQDAMAKGGDDSKRFIENFVSASSPLPSTLRLCGDARERAHVHQVICCIRADAAGRVVCRGASAGGT